MRGLRFLAACFSLALACSSNPVPSPPPSATLDWEYDATAAIRSVASKKLVVLYFYDLSCSYCTLMNDSFNSDEVRSMPDDVLIVGINIESSQFARNVGIRTVPTLIAIKPTHDGGEPLETFVGFLNPQQLSSFIKKNRAMASTLVAGRSD